MKCGYCKLEFKGDDETDLRAHEQIEHGSGWTWDGKTRGKDGNPILQGKDFLMEA